jgi:CelD/BcsL family acetyltransferase involved in cellulose biosynthesis
MHTFGDNRRRQFTAAGGSNIVVELYTGFDFRAGEYARLFARSNATPFQHPLWLDRFYAVLAPSRSAEPVVVTAREQRTGELKLVLPLIRRQKSTVTLLETTDLGVSDYAAPVIELGWRVPADLPEKLHTVLPSHDLMRIRPIRSETLGLWRACLGGDPVELDFSAHAVGLSADYREWRGQTLERGFAKYLDRRKKRFLKENGAGLRLLTGRQEIAHGIETLRRRRAGRFEGDPIQEEPVAEFYEAVAIEGAPAGLTRIYALTLAGEEIGHIFGISGKGRFHYLLIGCDYERHGRHSPGLIAYDLIIEDWIAAGGTEFDFTIGDEPFKRDFGTQPTAMFMLGAAPTWRGRLARAAYNAREQLRRLQRGRDTVRDGGQSDGGESGAA